ncbi:MAG: hypothetical protein AAFO77_00865 [Pseudomonadota bacterium]
MVTPFRKPLRLPSFLIMVGVTMAACYAFTAALPHDGYIRYQAMSGTIFERVGWVYERIHFDDAPVDIAFIGSSRTARGAISTDLEARLAAQGIDTRIVNFSIPAAGFDIRYVLAEELLSRKSPDLLVISVVEQFPRLGHQAFGELAPSSQVLGSPWIVNATLPENLARLPLRQLQLAGATQVPEAFGYQREFDPEAYAGTSIDPRIFNPGKKSAPKTAEDIAALERDSKFRRRSITRPLLPEALGWVEFGVPRTYLRRIADLAEAHGVQPVFLHLPFYGGYPEPFERAWLEQYGPVLTAEFLAGNPDFYNDVAHVSGLGADRITEWLAGELARLLEERKT